MRGEERENRCECRDGPKPPRRSTWTTRHTTNTTSGIDAKSQAFIHELTGPIAALQEAHSRDNEQPKGYRFTIGAPPARVQHEHNGERVRCHKAGMH
jgi:hypothetical protein